MKFPKTICALLFTALAAPVVAEDAAPSINIKRLTMESALQVAQGAVLDCRKKGYQVTATVVDKNGIVQAVVRDTLAPPVSIGISKDKAYTAVNFSADTSAMTERQDTPIGRIDGLVMTAGGVNISAGGTIFGAVGVSGAPSGKTDEECAKAGAAAVVETLEMAD